MRTLQEYRFPNLAGCDGACLIKIPIELAAAGIECYDFVPKQEFNSEVPYRHFGHLAGWFFRRAWYYWVVSRHDQVSLPFAYADPLQEKYGKDVRAGGDCVCRGPRVFYPPERGHFGCHMYHVDNQDGLMALADSIKLWNKEVATEAHLSFTPSDLRMLGRLGLTL